MQFLRSVCYNSFQIPLCSIRFFTNRPKSVILFYTEVFFSQPSFSEFLIFELYKKLFYKNFDFAENNYLFFRRAYDSDVRGSALTALSQNIWFSHHISYSHFIYATQTYFIKIAQFYIWLFIKTKQKTQTILTHVNNHDILKPINASACITKAPNNNASISTCIEIFCKLLLYIFFAA